MEGSGSWSYLLRQPEQSQCEPPFWWLPIDLRLHVAVLLLCGRVVYKFRLPLVLNSYQVCVPQRTTVLSSAFSVQYQTDRSAGDCVAFRAGVLLVETQIRSPAALVSQA